MRSFADWNVRMYNATITTTATATAAANEKKMVMWTEFRRRCKTDIAMRREPSTVFPFHHNSQWFSMFCSIIINTNYTSKTHYSHARLSICFFFGCFSHFVSYSLFYTRVRALARSVYYMNSWKHARAGRVWESTQEYHECTECQKLLSIFRHEKNIINKSLSLSLSCSFSQSLGLGAVFPRFCDRFYSLLLSSQLRRKTTMLCKR